MSEVLFEYISLGNAVKITAIDADSHIEAVVVAPLGLSETQMQKLALNKLNYIINNTTTKIVDKS